jgi:hypothetical protein
MMNATEKRQFQEMISSAVIEGLKAQKELEEKADAEKTDPAHPEAVCLMGFEDKHFKALDEFCTMMEDSKKAVRKTIFKVIGWAVIGTIVVVLGEKAKAILMAGANIVK